MIRASSGRMRFVPPGLTRSIRVLPDLCRLAWLSMVSRPALQLLHLIGVVVTVALVCNASFFAQAVDRAILSEELDQLTRRTGRAPFSLRVYTLPSGRRPLTLAAAERAAGHLAETLSAEIGLPLRHLGFEVSSGGLMLLPLEDDKRYGSSRDFLNTVEAVFFAEIEERIEIVRSEIGAADSNRDEGAVPVWMHADLAADMGVGLGEQFRLALSRSRPIGQIEVAGFWRARNPTDPFWFKDPDSTLRNALLFRSEHYANSIQPWLPSGSRRASWHIVLDDTALEPSRAADYIAGLDGSMAIINRYLPGARLDISPLEPLRRFVGRQHALTTTMLLFNLPAFAFLLYFLLLSANIGAHSRRREISIWISRGMSRSTLVGVTVVEILLLLLPGLPLGLLAALWLARLMGNISSFLTLSDRPPLPVSLQGFESIMLILAVAAIVVTRLLPRLAIGDNALHHERKSSRALYAPFWRRSHLDLLLLLPTLYVYRLLEQRGSFSSLFGQRGEAPFADPLMILLPVLFVVSATLFAMRLLPLLVGLLDAVAQHLPWLSLHLAMRHLNRQRDFYATSLLPVVALLAVGIYTQSMAASLDRWLSDRVHYAVGADLTFLPVRPTDSGAEPVVAPINWFSALPGVESGARVGDYSATFDVGGRLLRGRFLAIDRLTFPEVAWFRRDFSEESLGALMNRLARETNGVLIPRKLAEDFNLVEGDSLTVQVSFGQGVRVRHNVLVVGFFDMFPTLDGEDFLLIGAIDSLFLASGAPEPYEVWLDLTAETDSAGVLGALPGFGLAALGAASVDQRLEQESGRYERVGIFATLSVGFLSAALLAILALFLSSAAGLQERIYHFHILRALGLERSAILVQLAWEYLLLTAFAVGVGLLIGGSCSLLFSPFFRLGSGQDELLPPLIPLVDWTAGIRLTLISGSILLIIQISATFDAVRGRLLDSLRLGMQA